MFSRRQRKEKEVGLKSYSCNAPSTIHSSHHIYCSKCATHLFLLVAPAFRVFLVPFWNLLELFLNTFRSRLRGDSQIIIVSLTCCVMACWLFRWLAGWLAGWCFGGEWHGCREKKRKSNEQPSATAGRQAENEWW